MRNLLFFLLFSISMTMWSQGVTYDTIVEIKEVDKGIFDTILYVKKHVEIKKEVLVVDTVEGYRWAFGAYGGMALYSSEEIYTEPDLTFNASKTNGHNFGASLYYNFSKKWSIRVGAKLAYQKIITDYTKITNYTVDVSTEVDDTLDSYYNIIGTDTNHFQIIETKIIQSTEEKTNYSDLSYEWNLYYFKIPIQASYGLKMQRWNFGFLAGTSLNFRAKNLTSYPVNSQETVVSFYPSGIFSIQAGYFVRTSTVVHVEPFFEKSIVRAENSVIPSSQISLGIGLKQFF